MVGVVNLVNMLSSEKHVLICFDMSISIWLKCCYKILQHGLTMMRCKRAKHWSIRSPGKTSGEAFVGGESALGVRARVEGVSHGSVAVLGRPQYKQ